MRPTTAVLVALALAAPAAAQEGAPYASPDGDFTVAFPSPPAIAADPARRMNDVAQRRYVVQEPGRALVVIVDDYPEGDVLPSPNAAVYERLLDDYARGARTKLLASRPARLAGRPSLEGTFALGDEGAAEVVRVLILGRRIYRLIYAHGPAPDERARADAFFASFRVKP